MITVSGQPQESEFWKVLNRIWDGSGLPHHDLAVTLAALIYLRWADFQEAEQEAIAAFDDTDYKPVLPSSLHWRSWHLLPPHELQALFSNRLPEILEQLNNSRHILLATHLHRIASAVRKLGRLSTHALDFLIHWLADQPFETPRDRRELLIYFDAVLEKSWDKHAAAYRTPAAIVQLLVSLAAPSVGDRIYDPCFGSAGLLTAAFDYARSKATQQFSRSGSPALSVSGVEINLDAYIIGLVRLTLAGVDDPQIELGNSLERTPSNNPERDGFDIVLVDPPWGERTSLMGMDHYAIQTKDATLLFLQHALSQLRPEGRAVILMPEGFLFRKGIEEKLRHTLIKQHTIEAVISLNMIRRSIIVLRRGGETRRIRMVDTKAFFEGRDQDYGTIQQSLLGKLGQLLQDPKPGTEYWDVDVDALAEVDWDFTPKRRDQSGLVSILNTLNSEIEVVPLRTCVQTFGGRSFSKAQLTDRPPLQKTGNEQKLLFPDDNLVRQPSLFDVPVVPYVLIRDVQRGQATKGSSWLAEEAAASIDARWKLRTGDVLISKSGTIGKVGVVRNGAVGAIASSGLFVLRSDQSRLDPHFLADYLDSSECRLWLDDKGRGATIRHLSKRALDDMLVPLPPLQIQQRVAKQHRDHGVDVLAYLVQLLTHGEYDPIAGWLDEVIMGLPLDVDAVDDPLDLSPLDLVATSVYEVRNRFAHDNFGESALAEWILAFIKAVSVYRGVRTIPQGPGLLSVFYESRQALKVAMSLVKGHLPNESKAKILTNMVLTWVDRACSALLSKVKLVLSADTATLPVGEMAEIFFSIHNQGPLPLRNMSISTMPDWGSGEIAYLPEGAKTTVNFGGICPKKAGAFTLSVKCSAETLDGQEVHIEREFAFEAIEVEDKRDSEEVDLGKSPYFVSQPVGPDRDDVFFGREEQMNQIRRQVSSGNVILLEGNRRSGKSSILKHLEGPNSIPKWFGIYCSFQGAEGSEKDTGMPTVEVWREMARSVAEGLLSLGEDIPLPDGNSLTVGEDLGIGQACRKGISAEAPWAHFREYLKVVIKILTQKGMGLLLMLDEFDKLQQGIDNRVTSPQIPENIRYLVQNISSFSAILTGARRMKRLREDYWSALYGLGYTVSVTALPADAARRLVIEPVQGRLTYSREAVNRAIYLTSRQPYWLQCLCSFIFEMAVDLKTRTVTLDMVNQAGDALVENNGHFASLWGYVETDRRRFLLALCHKEASGPDALRLGVIQEYMFRHGIEMSDEALIADLEFLQDLELIKLVGEVNGGHYILALPLMGTWIEKQQDFAAVLSRARSETEDQHE